MSTPEIAETNQRHPGTYFEGGDRKKAGGCVGQCEHVNVDLGRREAFPHVEALYNERIYANGVGCGSAA